jgi:hypothetical protein
MNRQDAPVEQKKDLVSLGVQRSQREPLITFFCELFILAVLQYLVG